MAKFGIYRANYKQMEIHIMPTIYSKTLIESIATNDVSKEVNIEWLLGSSTKILITILSTEDTAMDMLNVSSALKDLSLVEKINTK